MTHSEIDLSASSWTLSHLTPALAPIALPAAMAATVPGCVHTDLLAAGLIPDPYLDRNEDDQHWIGRSDWLYRAEVQLPELDGRPITLVCDGLDTIATIRLNGIEVGASANMHRRYRFDLAVAARTGTNVLEVELSSAMVYAEALEAERGALPNAYAVPFNFIRKMACNFGWDWGPVLVTAGIWRALRLELGSGARLGDLRPQSTWGEQGAHLVLSPQISGDTGATELTTTISGPGLAPTEVTGSVDLDVPAAQPWWPHSLGDQPLYDVVVTLREDGEVVDTASTRVGFRTITLDTSPDEIGRRFAFAVNGIELFARGTNWIPDDCFVTRIDAARYAERIGQAKDAHVDLLRVWGGGIFEDEQFYRACDEAGMLVWQDFLFACAAYPEEEPIRSEVIAEARDNVSRLMPHASLALWNGNNENIWGHVDWGWAERLGRRTWGAGYYFDLLPQIVAEIDPSRAYWPGSPWSGDADVHPNAMTHGPSHLWDVWNTRDYTVYAEHDPRFASEFGFQGPPTWATLTAAVHDEPLRPDSPGMLAHEKAADGLGKLQRGLQGHLPTPTDGADWEITDWHYATQLNQARAVAFGIRHHRSLRGRCMGSVVWQINDCWPVSSWAALDAGSSVDGRPVARRKPLWYALRDAFADRVIIAGDDGVTLVNDTGAEWSGELTMTVFGLDGSPTTEQDNPRDAALEPTPFRVPARSSEKVASWLMQSEHSVLEVRASTGERDLVFGAEDVELALPAPAYDVTITPRDSITVEVTVSAQTLLRSVCLFADRVHPDAATDTMLIDLLPGRSHTFVVTGPAGFADRAEPDAWRTAPVLRCVNQLVTDPPSAPSRSTNPSAMLTQTGGKK